MTQSDNDPLSSWPSNEQLAELFPAAFVKHVAPTRPDAAEMARQNEGRTLGSRNKPRPLSTRARMILSLDLRSQSTAEIAQKMGLHERAVQWIRRTDRYIAAREALLGRMDAEFSAMKPAVFNALSNGLRSRDENTALRASETWMKAAGFGQYGKGNAQQGITAEDVARQLLQVNVNVNIAEPTPEGRRQAPEERQALEGRGPEAQVQPQPED